LHVADEPPRLVIAFVTLRAIASRFTRFFFGPAWTRCPGWGGGEFRRRLARDRGAWLGSWLRTGWLRTGWLSTG
jgi:hypothetical protein